MEFSSYIFEIIIYVLNVFCVIFGVIFVITGVVTFDTSIAISILIICLGILFIGAFFLGVFGVRKKKHNMLIGYAGLLFLLFIIQLILGIIFLYLNINKTVRNTYADKFKDYTKDKNVEKEINSDQTQYKCCGVDGPSDYMSTNILSEPPKKYPYSCCATHDNNYECVTPYTDGCANKVHDFHSRVKIIFGKVFIGFSFVWFVTACLTLFLVHLYRKEARGEA